MKALKNKLLVLAVGAVLTLAACGGNNPESKPADTSEGGTSQTTSQEATSETSYPTEYVRGDDDEIYDAHFGDFEDLVEAAHAEVDDDDQRYIKYAEAEGKMLAKGLMVPTYTNGGSYSISRIAPRMVSAAVHGLDSDRLAHLVIREGNTLESLISKEDRATLKAQWEVAREAGDSSLYDPLTFFSTKGWGIKKKYTVPNSAFPQTADVLNTYRAADTQPACNGIEGLVTYDNVNVLRGAMAEEGEDGKPYTVSADGKTYTFKIKQGMKWVNSAGEAIGDVTAQDFVDGFRHALDAAGGLEYLADGVIEGVHEYLNEETEDWADVGYTATDSQTLVIKLVKKENYFVSRLVYSLFMPMNGEFFLSKGGKFGVAAFAEAIESDNYRYGIPGDPTSILYNSAFYCSQWETTQGAEKMVYLKNSHYYDVDHTNLDEIDFVYEDGSNVDAWWNLAVDGTYSGIGLSAADGRMAKAKAAGVFDTCAYITDTDATTYFGALNLNRGGWSVPNYGTGETTQNDAQKILNHYAFNNQNFRLGFLHGLNREAWNDVAVGEGVGKFSLRNMYTYPEFVRLSKDVTLNDGKKFTADTPYGEIVEYFANKDGAQMSYEDGQDGWYNLELGKEYLAKAKEELKGLWKDGQKVVIEKINWTGRPSMVASNEAFKQIIEEELGDYIKVELLDVATIYEYYYAGYWAGTGEELPQDFFDGSGWGPDYVDPGSYLDTFSALRDASMLKVLGLDPQ